MKSALITFLFLLLLAAPTFAYKPLPRDPREKLINDEISEVNTVIVKLCDRSQHYAMFNQWDLAEAELRSAELSAQTVADLNRMRGHPYEKATDFDLAAKLDQLHQMRIARDAFVKNYNLPDNTMARYRYVQYKDGKHMFCTILYAVPDKKLTRDFIVAHLDQFIAGTADLECQTCAVTFNIDAGKPTKIQQLELPPNLLPEALADTTGGIIIARAADSRSTAKFLLHDGRQLEFLDGPAKGPVFTTLRADQSAHAGENGFFLSDNYTCIWAATLRNDDLTLTRYLASTLRWKKQITFRGDQIIRIDTAGEGGEGGEQKSTPLFDLASTKPITETIARELARACVLKLQRTTFTREENADIRPFKSVTFDDTEKVWTVLFESPVPGPRRNLLGVTCNADGDRLAYILEPKMPR